VSPGHTSHAQTLAWWDAFESGAARVAEQVHPEAQRKSKPAVGSRSYSTGTATLVVASMITSEPIVSFQSQKNRVPPESVAALRRGADPSDRLYGSVARSMQRRKVRERAVRLATTRTLPD
jgi:hypothetical protein